MKLIHLSDLHLGKRVNEFSMLEEQAYILTKIIDIVEQEKPDAVIIAGDVYDKSVPSAEAVELFDNFLVHLSRLHQQVFVISGNHDSAERMAFGGRLMDASGIHVSPVYDGEIAPISLEDEHGVLNVYLLPFLKPANVRRFFPDAEISSYTDALRVAVDQLRRNPNERNILVTHQFVTGAVRSDSEEISVGGTDNVEATVLDGFDYVALGHIHRPQTVGKETIRYCGTPLKYSFSEASHTKSVTVVTLAEKGSTTIKTIALVPRHDLREIKGTYMELTAKSYYEGTATDDYLHITLTDEEDILDAIGRLRVIYPNLMKLDYDNTRTRSNADISDMADIERKTPIQLFADFYEMQNNKRMSEEQLRFTEALIEKIWEDEA